MERERSERGKGWDSDFRIEKPDSSERLGGCDLGQWPRGLELQKDASFLWDRKADGGNQWGCGQREACGYPASGDEGLPWDLTVLGVGTARSPLRQRKRALRGGLKGPSEGVGTSERIGRNSWGCSWDRKRTGPLAVSLFCQGAWLSILSVDSSELRSRGGR